MLRSTLGTRKRQRWCCSGRVPPGVLLMEAPALATRRTPAHLHLEAEIQEVISASLQGVGDILVSALVACKRVTKALLGSAPWSFALESLWLYSNRSTRKEGAGILPRRFCSCVCFTFGLRLHRCSALILTVFTGIACWVLTAEEGSGKGLEELHADETCSRAGQVLPG